MKSITTAAALITTAISLLMAINAGQRAQAALDEVDRLARRLSREEANRRDLATSVAEVDLRALQADDRFRFELTQATLGRNVWKDPDSDKEVVFTPNGLYCRTGSGNQVLRMSVPPDVQLDSATARVWWADGRPYISNRRTLLVYDRWHLDDKPAGRWDLTPGYSGFWVGFTADGMVEIVRDGKGRAKEEDKVYLTSALLPLDLTTWSPPAK